MSCRSLLVIRLATASVSWGATSCMSASRLAIVTETCSPVGRSATRVRIGSGSVSWRRRLCARLGEMPRSAHTAAIRSASGSPARASQQSRSCSCWSARLRSSRALLTCAWMRRTSSGAGWWSSSSTIRLCTGSRPFEPVAAGELVAGLGGEQPALAVVEEDRGGGRRGGGRCRGRAGRCASASRRGARSPRGRCRGARWGRARARRARPARSRPRRPWRRSWSRRTAPGRAAARGWRWGMLGIRAPFTWVDCVFAGGFAPVARRPCRRRSGRAPGRGR